MRRRIREIASVARVLLAYAFVGSIYGGFAVSMAMAAATVLRTSGVPPRFLEPGFVSEFLQSSIFGFVFGIPGGAVMGIIAGIIGGRWSWIFGGFVSGYSYCVIEQMQRRGSCIQLSAEECTAMTLALMAWGFIVAVNITGKPTFLPLLPWLHKLAAASPLENKVAWKRTATGFALPLTAYLALIAYQVLPAFWANRAYIPRLGLATTWRQSYYFATLRNIGGRSTCQSNLKQVMLAIKQYEQDYDDQLPLVNLGGQCFGWGDAISIYLNSAETLQCPTEFIPSNNNPRQSEYTDYWFNSKLSGMNESAFNQTPLTITLGDGNDGVNVNDARYTKSTLPMTWINSSASPAYRHPTFRGGANYAFLDGHVKWLLPKAISLQPSQTLPNFHPK